MKAKTVMTATRALALGLAAVFGLAQSVKAQVPELETGRLVVY